MTTHNEWVKSNLADRKSNPLIDFSVTINPYQFNSMDFQSASDYTAKLISSKYPKLFLALSGGADSDFVFHVFYRNNIPITPIVVITSGNEIEVEYALHSCRKFNIEPLIINLSNEELLKKYAVVCKQLNSPGLLSVPGIIACEHARDNGGIVIIGEHMIDHNENRIFPGMNSWDFLNEAYVGEEYSIPFFMYTVELTYAMVEAIEQIRVDEYKNSLYNIDYRPIIKYKFEKSFYQSFQQLISVVMNGNPKFNFSLGSKEKFLTYLNNWKR